ncbi:phage minor capsid protein [Ruminococcus champanellensis]|uniref:Phage minor capsid protein 2 n=1 Tax=Ruminococcus champanellensis (strain DSM 18848 / JCM 17042 / KCTC 15320 / 18P13) TaxID=213810 RepID=D4LE01_RUMC1|nr:phage minor capsid protein [Ruminococcus champanellensis]CBL17846.1 Phage minor capsid protein 2 [Ruminococcus champanellensis 18P13 = JCM 17042]DAZ47778.1 MAG TPA: minor capsid protein [Caudoviricetes sp.]
MLTPDYLLHCTDSLTELLDAYDNAVVSDIARRIVKTGYVTETAKHQLRQAQQMGLLYEDIIREIAQRANATDSMVRTLFENAGVETVETDNRLYTAAGLQTTDLRASPAMLQMLQAGYENTLGTMHNLTLTTANTAQQAYISACDLAMLQVQSGAMSYQQAIRAAIQSAASDGTRVLYPSGRTDRIEVAVRRAVLTGVAKTCRTIGEYNAASCGCDLMELSAHAGARPSHARWQGQLVSLSGKRGYLSKDDIGYGSGDGFGGYNCRHDWYPFFPGISQRNYTPEKLTQLETMTVNYNGQEIPYYDATQEQRRLERRVRDCKLRLSATDAARQETTDPKLRAQLDEDFAKQSKALRDARDKLADFQNGTGLLPDTSRTQVYGFGRSIAQKAVTARKRVDKSGKGGIIVNKEKLSKYIGKPIVETDNQHIREWYYANVGDIPNQIDRSKSREEQARQAYTLRNQYKHQARAAMSDEETAKMLEETRPVIPFDELLESKMRRKGLSKEEAMEDIIQTASKTNADVNKEFGL